MVGLIFLVVLFFLEEERMSSREGFGCRGYLIAVGGKDASAHPCDILVRRCGWKESESNVAASQK